jgi:Tol biopolymer transport system component
VSAAAPAANDSPAKPAAVELRDEIVRVPLTPSIARAGRPSAPVERDAFSPAFAPEGTAIFFHTGDDRDARSAIEVAKTGNRTDGELGIMTIVDDGSHNYHAQPSPDGRFVAFDSDRDGERGVYVANRDGSQVRRVSGAGYAALPRWSRNGEWLAYVRPEADKPAVWNLWVQPATGGDARRLTNYRYGQTWAASWFPGDQRIAYSHEDTLMVMDLQTGGTTRYPTPVKGRLVRTPAVSPDGAKIIFQVFRHGAWLLNVADGSMQRVITDPTAEEFAWSPDGRRIAFHSRRDGQWGIYMLLGG